jgi:hypothetical protein
MPYGTFDRYCVWAILRQNTDPSSSIIKSEKPWQIWLTFSLQDVFEPKKYKNGKKNR